MASMSYRGRCITASLSRLVLLLALPLASSRIYTGSLPNDPSNPVLAFFAKFAYGVDASSGIAGSFALTTNCAGDQSTDDQLNVLMYDDTAWSASIYNQNPTCATAFADSTATLGTTCAFTPSTATRDIAETSRPHYWYFMFANLDCSALPGLSFTVTMLQADGSQLSYDELGMPALFVVMWLFFTILTVLHVYFHYFREKFKPLLVVCISAALITLVLSVFFGMCYWLVVQSSGLNNEFLIIAQYLFRFLCQMFVWTCAALLANGYGVTSFSLRHSANIIGISILVLFLILYIAAGIFRTVGYNPENPNADISSWPLIVLIITTIIYAIWFIYTVRRTILQETRLDKRAFIWRLSIVLVMHMSIILITEFSAAVTPEYNRLKVRSEFNTNSTAANFLQKYQYDSFAVIVEYTFTLVAFILTVACLWPSIASSAFKGNDTTHSLLSAFTETDDYKPPVGTSADYTLVE